MKGLTRLLVATSLLSPLGACSSDGGTTTPAVTVPGAPTGVVATIGDGSITLAFIAPAINGGATISGYTAACSAVGVTRSATGSSSPITVTGLSSPTRGPNGSP